MSSRPLVGVIMGSHLLATLLINTIAAFPSVVFLRLAHYDTRPHKEMFTERDDLLVVGIWVLWTVSPYIGLAALGSLVRRCPRAECSVCVASILIALPALILVSPLIYEPPS